MDKKEYVIRQLGKTNHKKCEAYVVTRIIHLLNDFSIKFVTQQHVSRRKEKHVSCPKEGRALTDLFFPQFDLHIEVDEGQHFTRVNIEKDKNREADIINATGHKILRVDVTKSLDDINAQISKIVKEIRGLRETNRFVPWDIATEFNPETYVERGYIDIADNVAFKTIKDACNCFGHNYSHSPQRGGVSHPDSDIILFFPKLFPNQEWDNQISNDEETIKEKNTDPEKAKDHVCKHLNNKDEKHQRIVFAKVKDNLGGVLYRFRGLYKLDVHMSNKEGCLVWKRIKTRVETYPQPQC